MCSCFEGKYRKQYSSRAASLLSQMKQIQCLGMCVYLYLLMRGVCTIHILSYLYTLSYQLLVVFRCLILFEVVTCG